MGAEREDFPNTGTKVNKGNGTLTLFAFKQRNTTRTLVEFPLSFQLARESYPEGLC